MGLPIVQRTNLLALLVGSVGWLLLAGGSAAQGSGDGKAEPTQGPGLAEVKRQVDALKAAGLDAAEAAPIEEALKAAREEITKAQEVGQQAKALRDATAGLARKLEEVRARLRQALEDSVKALTAAEPEWAARLSATAVQSEVSSAALNQVLDARQRVLEDVQQREEEAEAALAATERAMAERAARRAELPEQLAKARANLDQASAGGAKPSGDRPAPGSKAAADALLESAKRARLAAEVEKMVAELASMSAQQAELKLEERKLALQVREHWAAQLREAQQLVTDARRQATAAAQREAQEIAQRVAAEDPALSRLIRRNRELTDKARAVSDRIDREQAAKERAEKQLDALVEMRERTKKRIGVAPGLTDAIGQLLRQQRARLPDPRILQANIDRRGVESRTASYELLVHQDELLDEDRTRDQRIAEWIQQAGVTGIADRTAYAQQAGELLEAEERYLRSLIAAETRYTQLLADLDSIERDTLIQSREHRQFIDKKIFSIRSSPALWDPSLRWTKTLDSLALVTSTASWQSVFAALWSGALTRIVLVLQVLVLVLLIWHRRRLIRRLKADGESAGRGAATRFEPTARALLWTVLIAVPISLLLLVFSTWLQGGVFVEAVGGALRVVAWELLGIDLLRTALRENGLALAHFGWTPTAVRPLRRYSLPLLFPGLPLLFASTLFQKLGDDLGHVTLARVTFIAFMVLLAIVLGAVFRPRRGVLHPAAGASKSSIFVRTRWVWYLVAIATPITLGVLCAIGYDFTAFALSERLYATLVAILCLVLVHGLALRWFLVARRRASIQRSKDRVRARELAGEGETDDLPMANEPEVDLGAVHQQTRMLLRTLLTLSLVGAFWIVWFDVLPALRNLEEVTLWSAGDDSEVTLFNLLLVGVTCAVVLLAVRSLPGLIEVILLQRLQLGAGERYAISTLLRYLLILIGVLLAFSFLGLGWSRVQWLAAAATVGIGFGLQEIFANFFSGLIILFERPIRVGDVVTIGSSDGKVARIRMRATTVVDWDRRELVIPNKEIITGLVINWTLSDGVTRFVLSVGVAYGSDVEATKRILLEVADSLPHKAQSPQPSVVFRRFGDSALEFQLRVYLSSLDHWTAFVDTLHSRVDQRFREAGLDIAFPQRVVHLRGNGPVEVSPSTSAS